MLCPAVCRVKTLSPEGNSRGRPYPDKLVAARTTLGSQDCRHGTFKFYDNPVVSTSIIRASEVVLGHYFLPLFSLLMRFLKRQSWNFVLLVKAATAKTTAQKIVTMTESATWSEKLMFILSSFFLLSSCAWTRTKNRPVNSRMHCHCATQDCTGREPGSGLPIKGCLLPTFPS